MVLFFCIPCLMLVAYFVVAGIFFPKYRTYVKEGWKCFTDKIRGKICSISFDNRMRLAFSGWLAKKGFVKAGKFFYDQKKFNITLTIIAIVFTVVSTYLFFLLVSFLIKSPCSAGSSCSVPV